MIATCSTCHRVMAGASCTDTRAHPFGAEPGWPSGETPDWPCHDCGTPPGGLHHPGCAVARCTVCGDQLLACLDGEHAPIPLHLA